MWKFLVPWDGQSYRLIDYMMNKQSIVVFMIETSSQTISHHSKMYSVTTLRFPLDMSTTILSTSRTLSLFQPRCGDNINITLDNPYFFSTDVVINLCLFSSVFLVTFVIITWIALINPEVIHVIMLSHKTLIYLHENINKIPRHVIEWIKRITILLIAFSSEFVFWFIYTRFLVCGKTKWIKTSANRSTYILNYAWSENNILMVI